MIRYQKERANKFPRRMCSLFVSDWLEVIESIFIGFVEFFTFLTVC